jgi:YidC/Oxa1 family membrane protein insertase
VERRLAVFLVLTVVLWTGFIALRVYLLPPQPVAKQQQADKNAPAAENAKEKVAEKQEPIAKEPVRPAAAAAPEPSKVARQRVAIGSADPTSGHSAVYYFDNQGAALECVELNGKKYKSVEDHTGYLGRLSLSSAVGGGAAINVVGAGTPAALADAGDKMPPGLKAGDVIRSIDGKPIADEAALDDYLKEKKRPGQKVTLSVEREGVAGPVTFSAVLTHRPLEIVRPEYQEYRLPNGRMFRALTHDPLSLLLTLETIGTRPPLSAADEELPGLPSLYQSNWAVDQAGDDFVEFSMQLDEAALAAAKVASAGPLKIVKRFSVPKADKPGNVPYHLNLHVSIQNLGQQPLAVGYRLNGPTGLPLEGWWYSTKLNPNWGGAGARDVVWDQAGLGHQLLGCPKIVSDARQKNNDKKPEVIDLLAGESAAPFHYIGVDTQFFSGVIQPQATDKDRPLTFRSAYAMPVQDVISLPKTRLRTADVSVRLATSPSTIEAGGELKHDYRVFLGPKDPSVLSAYGLDRLIEYGWPIFAVPAKLLRNVLNGLYWLTGLIGLPNYGIAIILLTVIVRTCMIPISLKQARSAAKMQELAPEIQKIKDKFPDDPMKQHQAVQELYKKHDFNMFGGCLPVFIQLPIFIGLYRCLSVDIDLRDAALVSQSIEWASNLAGPDKLFYWKDWMPVIVADEADGWLGPFFNVFPLITVALFLVQQKMFTPPATDDQTRMQQQMMTYMTVFMGFMFFKVPAGLCIYFITSSLWGICERKLLPKPKPKDGRGGEDGGGMAAKLFAKSTNTNGSSKPGSSKRPKQRR